MYCLSVKGSQFQALLITLYCSKVYLKCTSVHTWWALIENPARILICTDSGLSRQAVLQLQLCSLEKLIHIPLPSFRTLGFQRVLDYAIPKSELDLGRCGYFSFILFFPCQVTTVGFWGVKGKKWDFPIASSTLLSPGISRRKKKKSAMIWKPWRLTRIAGLLGMSAFTCY